MAELADAPDLGSGGRPCRFKSCYPQDMENVRIPLIPCSWRGWRCFCFTCRVGKLQSVLHFFGGMQHEMQHGNVGTKKENGSKWQGYFSLQSIPT